MVALDVLWKSEGEEPAGAGRLAVEALHRLPGDTPSGKVCSAGDLIVALDAVPGEERRFSGACTLSESRGAHLLKPFAVVYRPAARPLRIEKGTGGMRGSPLRRGANRAGPAAQAEEVLKGSHPGPETCRRAAMAALVDAKKLTATTNSRRASLAGILVRCLIPPRREKHAAQRQFQALPASLSIVNGVLNDA